MARQGKLQLHNGLYLNNTTIIIHTSFMRSSDQARYFASTTMLMEHTYKTLNIHYQSNGQPLEPNWWDFYILI